MWYVVPFEAEHIFRMDLQEAQEWIKERLVLSQLRNLENEWAITVMVDGEPIACAGPIVYWPGRALLWSFISRRVDQSNFLKIHRRAKAFIAELPFRRLEANVDVNFEAGHRWVNALGFELEAPRMKAFYIDGRDCSLYAKIKEG
jgi:RimJ/RimL family protein N-acetyltransferase